MYKDYVAVEVMAAEVQRDVDDHEINGSDNAMDRLEVLLRRVGYKWGPQE
jgi:hypothetical protein